MVNQNPSYLKLKGSTYYFTRRVPKVLHKFSNASRVDICLHTSSKNIAHRQANLLSAELEEQWNFLRRRETSRRLSSVFGKPLEKLYSTVVSENHSATKVLLSDALETYLDLKGVGRSKTFETSARRSINYFLEITKDKPIDIYSRAEANAFRELLRARGLSVGSIKRNLTNVRAIINFVSKEHGLPSNSAFSGVYLGENIEKSKRYVPSTSELIKLNSKCKNLDDERRWLLALISDTGMRLAEATGIEKDDVHLDTPIPFVEIKAKHWRRLKTSSSERVIPLVGISLWGARKAYATTHTEFLFPKYCNVNGCNANSASAALNKWLKKEVSTAMVIHSLRHSLRDRLREVECPSDVIDRIGGWSRSGIGESYGKGHKVKTLHKWLRRIVL
jgi:integrase